MAAMDPIVISVTADIGPLTAGMSQGVSALAVMEKQGKSLQIQLDKIGESGVAFQKSVAQFAGVSAQVGKSAAASADAFRAFDAAKSKIDALRASIDPLFAASKRYEAALSELDSGLASGVIKTAEYDSMVEQLGTTYLSAAPKIEQAVGHIEGMGKASKLSYMQVQELGHVTRSFVDVIAAGGSPMRAFQFEGMRIASILGQGGGPIATIKALGAGIVEFLGPVGLGIIGVGLLGAALYEFYPRAETFAKAIENATKDNDLYGKSFAALVSDMDAAKSLQNEYIAAVQAGSAATIEAVQKEAAIRVKLLELDKLDLQEKADAAAAAASAADAAYKRAQKAVDARLDQIAALKAAQDSDGAAGDRQADMSFALNFLKDETAELQKQTPLHEKASLEWQLIGAKIDANNSKLAIVTDLTKQIADGTVTITGGLNAAAGAAGSLAGNLQAAAAAEAAMGNMKPGGAGFLANQYSQYGAGHAAMDKTQKDNSPLYGPSDLGKQIDPLFGTKIGKSGGGGKDPLTGDLEKLQNSLKTATQIELENYTSRQKTLDQALAARMISQQTYLQSEQVMQEQHAQKMVGLDVWHYGDTLQQAGAFFGQMANAMQSGNQKMQDIGKKFAAAEALMNAWRAFSQVLADPKLPWYAKIPAGISVLSAGMGAVSALGGNGGGKGAATSAAAAASGSASGGQAQPGTYMNFSFQGAYGSTEEFGRFMVGAINQAVENGAVIRGARIA